MKTNFLKIVLPTFALILAITTSLAFTSYNNSEDVKEITTARYLDYAVTPSACVLIHDISCQTNQVYALHPICTVTLAIPAGTFHLYDESSNCNPASNILYRYIP